LVRKPNLTILEIPGFGVRAAAVIYIAVGAVLGMTLGRRATFLAMQLGSQTLVGGTCASLLRRPFIVLSTIAGEISEVDEALVSRARFMHRRHLRQADYLVGQTSEAAQELMAFAPQERVAVVNNPMPPGGSSELDGRPHAVFTGRLALQKNLPLLLEAWKTVVDRVPEARLTLVGDGGCYQSVEDELRRTVASSATLANTVTFTGWVEDVGRYLRAADIYVFPSRSEGMSNSLLEACAWGRIIVASDIAPNCAVLGQDYPLMFPTGDRDGLAKALIQAFENTDTRAAAATAIARRRAELSRSAIGGYEEVLLAANGLAGESP